MTSAQPISYFDPRAESAPRANERIDIIGRRLVGLIVVVWAASLVVGFIPAVIVLTTAGFVATIAGLANPAIGVFGIGMLCSLDPLTRVFMLTGGLLRWNSFNYLMVIALMLAPATAMKLSDVHSRVLAAFALLLGLQLTITADVATGSQTMLQVLAPFGILLYFARTGYDAAVISWLGTIVGVLSALGGFVYFLQLDSLPLMNKNAWSAFPLTGLFCVCFSYLLASTSAQMRLGWLAAVNTVWVFLSGSRGAMFIGIVCVVFLLLRTRSREHRLILFVVAPAVAALLLMLFSTVTDTSMHRLTMLFDSERELESRTSGRSELYVAGWRIFSANPLGVGTGGFPKELAKMADRDLLFTGRELGAHSAWVKVLAENGIFGVLVLAAYVVSFAVAGMMSRNRSYESAGILVTMILVSAFFSREFHSKGLWLAAALYIALTRNEKQAGLTA